MKFAVPEAVKILALVLGATAFFTYLGQLVPQKEVLPPQETVMSADMTTDDLVQVGLDIANGKGLCFTCHTLGKSGLLRFPDLEGIAVRSETRIEGLNSLEYMASSIYDPDGFIVEGFSPGMPQINKPPIGLNDQEILAVLAYLQSLGGTPTITLETTPAELGRE
jgi:mono/diheme cytochrome c family protein